MSKCTFVNKQLVNFQEARLGGGVVIEATLGNSREKSAIHLVSVSDNTIVNQNASIIMHIIVNATASGVQLVLESSQAVGTWNKGSL